MLRKIINDDQNAKNTVKLNAGEAGCCGDMATACQYTASYAKAGAVTAITISEGGVNKVLPCAIAANATAATVNAAILTALTLAGYEHGLQDGDQYEGIKVVTGATNHDITLIGNAKLVSITHAGGTATATEKCAEKYQCDFNITGFAGGATGTAATAIRINGLTATLGDVVPGTTTASAVKTQVEAALTSAGIVSGTVVVATVGTGGSQTYNITIPDVAAATTIGIGGKALAKSACELVFA